MTACKHRASKGFGCEAHSRLIGTCAEREAGQGSYMST